VRKRFGLRSFLQSIRLSDSFYSDICACEWRLYRKQFTTQGTWGLSTWCVLKHVIELNCFIRTRFNTVNELFVWYVQIRKNN
jgi:hypothetical protein